MPPLLPPNTTSLPSTPSPSSTFHLQGATMELKLAHSWMFGCHQTSAWLTDAGATEFSLKNSLLLYHWAACVQVLSGLIVGSFPSSAQHRLPVNTGSVKCGTPAPALCGAAAPPQSSKAMIKLGFSALRNTQLGASRLSPGPVARQARHRPVCAGLGVFRLIETLPALRHDTCELIMMNQKEPSKHRDFFD